MVQVGNLYYFAYLAVGIGSTVGLYFLLRKRSAKVISRVIFGMLAFGFLLHFLKQLFEPYRSDFPLSLRKSSFENVCAVSVLVFPFFFLSKNKYLKDYMFYFGVLGGAAAFFFPTEAIGKSPFTFDTIRFYVCHFVLVAAPLLAVIFKLHTLSYRRAYKTAFTFFAVLGIILINEVILIACGYVDGGWEGLMDPNSRNSSLIFGPSDTLAGAAKLLTALTPELFKTVPVGANAGQAMYWPIVWMVIPVMIYFTVISFLLTLPFDYAAVKKDFVTVKNKLVIFKDKIFKKNRAEGKSE